ncbi:MAG: helix-turn-helix domain-containing protein [Ruminococcus sp.]|nr:helix-turn-helix domain-containing protein [Ruminococcus sp.]
MTTKKSFHSNLAKRRKELGLTQEMLAQKINVSPQAVSKWEKSSYPDPELLPYIAKALNTSIDSLFGSRSSDTEIDIFQLVHDRIQSLSPDKRSHFLIQLFYSAIYAYNPSFTTTKDINKDYNKETYAGIKTDYDIAIERLNPDLRYFVYLETPENGVNNYFTNMKNMARLFYTISDEDGIRIISYLGGGRRNKMHSVPIISKRLNIPVEKVQYVIDRLDRLGMVWRVSVDMTEKSQIMYGYTHNQALPIILVLAESVCNYFGAWDPSFDDYSLGVFKDETGKMDNSLPDVSFWKENEK